MEEATVMAPPRRLTKLAPVGVAADALRQVKFDFAATALAPRQGFKPTYAEWEACGDWLRSVDGAVQWWIGDWLRMGEELFGEEHAQALDLDTSWDQRTLEQMRWVSDKVSVAVRRGDLSWAHHREVAALETPQAQKDWLERAATGTDGVRWPVDRLRRELQAKKKGGGASATLWVMVEAHDAEDADRIKHKYEAEGRKVKVR